MKDLLERLAQAGLDSLHDPAGRQPGEVVGTGAYGVDTAAVDAQVEGAILHALEAEGNPVNVLSEEVGFVDHDARMTLVLDPVDGTHNAVRGIPAWGISLAVGETSLSDVQHALVMDVPGGNTYYAEAGGGATLNGGPISTSALDPAAALFLVALGTNAAEEAYQVAASARRVRHLGAACLDMCMVAQGSADLYYNHARRETAKIRVVDVAAATLIVREAGGGVVDAAGGELDMPFTLEARSDVIAWGDPRALEMLP